MIIKKLNNRLRLASKIVMMLILSSSVACSHKIDHEYKKSPCACDRPLIENFRG